jgi:hypothetical protein
MEFDELINELDKLKEEGSIDFKELFVENFMIEYTKGKYKTYQDFFTSGGFSIGSQEEFENIPEEKLNEYVKKETDFQSWEEMLQKAGDDYFEKRFS